MRKMTIVEMENYVMLEEMRTLKNEPTITYEEFLKIVGLKRTSDKNQSKSNTSINHPRR
jgi:hypothetical protein